MKAEKTLGGGVRDALRERIVRGELAPNERLREASLAAELGVSRTPLREALFQLACEGFVRSEPERGFCVKALEPREVREIYPMIWTLEALAVRTIGPLAPGTVPALERHNALLAVATNAVRALELNDAWHEALVAPCPNRRLRETLAGLRLAVRHYENVYMSDALLLGQSVEQHRAIAEALRAGDLDRALALLEANWRDGMVVLLAKLGEP
ncbi:MAG TPA: GntR family transcriptional regulator [Polyangiaceae bacterium]|nr:GntR family transcriptional regulator [Polyangiaceae bacterium]